MSRYPSGGVERFDQQFAETENERNERLRRKRLKSEMSDLDRLHEKENEIARLMAENIRLHDALDHAVFEANSAIEGMKKRDGKITYLTALVQQSYNEGFLEGRRDYSSFHGGKTWHESHAYRSVLRGQDPKPDDYDHYANEDHMGQGG